MKKLINAAEDVVSQSLAGFCAAHSDIVRMGERAPFVQRRNLKPGKVALISGGGWGMNRCIPALSAMACWTARVRARFSPRRRPISILAAAEAADNGGGVLFIVKNCEGES